MIRRLTGIGASLLMVSGTLVSVQVLSTGTALAINPPLRVLYDQSWPVAWLQKIKGAPIDAFTELHRCFNCSFPVPGAPQSYPGEGQYMPLRPCPPIWLPFGWGCQNAPVDAYPRDENDYLQLIAQPGHFDGAGSTVTFKFYTDSQGYLWLNVVGKVANSTIPDALNRAAALSTWDLFSEQLAVNMSQHGCPQYTCPPAPPTPTGSAVPCSSLGAVVCTGGQATVLDTSCPGGTQQWFSTTDANGVPINWTYADGSRGCMRVTYYTYPTSTDCAFWFYVPKGNATGYIAFGWWDTNGVKHYWWIDEDPIDGWQELFTASDVVRVEWQDNNGQPAGSTELGWGPTSQHGFAQRCS